MKTPADKKTSIQRIVELLHCKPQWGTTIPRIHPWRSPKFVIGIIDVQNDFCKGGKLAVPEAEEAIAAINKLRYLYDNHVKAFLSMDWHNENHMSFAERHQQPVFSGPVELSLVMENGTTVTVNQMMWPRHCVENTEGAKIHCDLIVSSSDYRIYKGTKTNVESYSAFGDEFEGKHEQTTLHAWLTAEGASDIILTGIASDYCVYFTAIDAIRLGYKVHLILSCVRGVSKETTVKAFVDLTKQGVLFYDSVDAFHRANLVAL